MTAAGGPLAAPGSDAAYMEQAVLEAEFAARDGEVPVGAVVVRRGRIIARGHNQRERLNDPTAHAEMIAITEAASAVDGWRLEDVTLYVTLEPCPMCAGAIRLARIPRVIFGARDPRMGAGGSLFALLSDDRLENPPEVVSGILEDRCRSVLVDFFRRRRAEE